MRAEQSRAQQNRAGQYYAAATTALSINQTPVAPNSSMPLLLRETSILSTLDEDHPTGVHHRAAAAASCSSSLPSNEQSPTACLLLRLLYRDVGVAFLAADKGSVITGLRTWWTRHVDGGTTLLVEHLDRSLVSVAAVRRCTRKKDVLPVISHWNLSIASIPACSVRWIGLKLILNRNYCIIGKYLLPYPLIHQYLYHMEIILKWYFLNKIF